MTIEQEKELREKLDVLDKNATQENDKERTELAYILAEINLFGRKYVEYPL